jgi:hypothetical protein
MKNLVRVTVIMILLGSLFLTPATSLGLEAGETAPAFSGESTRGPIRLSDFSGKKNVVLALYFAIFTSV